MIAHPPTPATPSLAGRRQDSAAPLGLKRVVIGTTACNYRPCSVPGLLETQHARTDCPDRACISNTYKPPTKHLPIPAYFGSKSVGVYKAACSRSDLVGLVGAKLMRRDKHGKAHVFVARPDLADKLR